MKNNSNEILNLMYSLANDQPYRPSSYTTIREFTPSFVKLEEIRAKFVTEPPMAKYEWVPEEPYPKMYTKGYKKTILSSL